MKQPVSIRDKLASKRKRVFRHLASCERRALYLRRAYCGEILSRPRLLGKISLPPAFRGKISPPSCLLTKFYLVSTFLNIVPISATASFGQNFTPLAIGINRVACFVAKFYRYPQSVQSPLVYRKTPARKKVRYPLYRPAFTSYPSRKF